METTNNRGNMKLSIELNDSDIAELAEKLYPELMRYEKCCNGRDCGCQGGLDADYYDAMTQLEDDMIDDVGFFAEVLTEYGIDVEIS